MISSILMLALSSVLQADTPSAPKSIRFVSKEGGFSVNLPSKPTEAIKSVDTPAGVLINKIFQANDGKNVYTIICADYPGELGPELVEPFLDGVRQGYTQSTGGKITEDRKIKVRDLPGREVTMEVEGAIQRARYFLKGRRIYQLLVSQANADDDPAAFRRFVASFKVEKAVGNLQDAPVAQADWADYHSEAGGFRVRLLGHPVEQVQKIDTPVGPINMHVCNSSNALVPTYGVFFSARGADTLAIAPTQMLDSVVEGALANEPNSKLIRQKPIDLNGVPGREAEISLPPNAAYTDGVFLVRYYLTRDRLYQVAYVGPRADAKSKEVMAFLDSFRLDSAPGAEPKPNLKPNSNRIESKPKS